MAEVLISIIVSYYPVSEWISGRFIDGTETEVTRCTFETGTNN